MLAIVYLATVSLIMGVMGLVILWRRVTLFTRGARATGTFVRWEIRGIRRQFYFPVVAFQADDGNHYEFTGGPGYGRPVKKTTFEVIYPSNAPEKAMILSLLAFWAAPPAFFILAAGAAFAALQQSP